MGYSCTAKAGDTLAYIEKAFQSPDTKIYVQRINNADYFFERGQEQADGSITGTAFRFVSHVTKDNETPDAIKAGSVKIAANGMLVRFPGMKAGQRTAINIKVAGGLDRATARGL